MRSIFNFQFSIFNSKNGFTLIELIIVTAVIGIVSAIGTSAFVSYSRTQKLQTATNDLVTVLNVAKSNALSQVKKPALCADSNVLNGYKVVISSSTTYDLYVVCSGQTDKKVVNTKSLPANIIFSSIPPSPFFFPVLTGGVIGSGMVQLLGYGQTRSITVTNAGVIK